MGRTYCTDQGHSLMTIPNNRGLSSSYIYIYNVHKNYCCKEVSFLIANELWKYVHKPSIQKLLFWKFSFHLLCSSKVNLRITLKMLFATSTSVSRTRSVLQVCWWNRLWQQTFGSLTHLSKIGPDSTGPFTALHMESAITRPSGCLNSWSVSLQRYLEN